MDFKIERKGQQDETAMLGSGVILTPPISEEYWSYRIGLSEAQALVAFPKFGTIGIGFAVEEDWNSNLPWGSDPGYLLVHIGHNKGDDSIADEDVYDAIVALQAAIAADHDTTWREHYLSIARSTPILAKDVAVAKLAEKRLRIEEESEDE